MMCCMQTFSLFKKGRNKLSHKLPRFLGHSCSPLNPSTLSLSLHNSSIHPPLSLPRTRFPSLSLKPFKTLTPNHFKSSNPQWQELVAVKHSPSARLLTQDHYETNYQEKVTELGWVQREHHRHLHRHKRSRLVWKILPHLLFRLLPLFLGSWRVWT